MFSYIDRSLYCEQAPLASIAKEVGTPCYVYSSQTILDAYRAYDHAFNGLQHLVCFAVKSNSTLAVLSLLAKEGSGFDIVSAGELYRVLQAGGDPERVVFSGVGKSADEIEYALAHNIHSFNCESEGELTLLDALAARAGKVARFALRVNPDVDATTHPYISTGLREHKFGIDIEDALAVYERARSLRNVRAEGVSCHIGSQLLEIDPILQAADKVLGLVDRLRANGHDIEQVDLGGGLGVAYQAADRAPAIETLVRRLHDRIASTGLRVMVEPGRSIVGPAGVMLTRVLYRKQNAGKEFVIVDAAMNDLIRPSLYQSHHEILPVEQREATQVKVDVVGPICETGDFLARNRLMTGALPGDYLAVQTAGAYGFVQSSNYNSRPRAAEVLVEGSSWRVVRGRESFADLVRGETV